VYADRVPAVAIEEHDLGLTWVVEEPMRRACHAIADGGRVWLVDSVDHAEALERAAALGKPEAVLQLLDRHNRDCAEIASRLGVPHLKLPDAVPDSPFEAISVLRLPIWRETALWWPERSALVVAEVLGTSRMYTGGRGAVGVHLFLRGLPPGSLRGRDAEHLLVGHGPTLHGPQVSGEIERAYASTRRDLPHVLLALPGALRG
jgi:hypothetical protein